MSQKISNNGRSRLVSAIADNATTFTIESATADTLPVANTTDWLEPEDWFKAVLENSLGQIEIIYVGIRNSGSGVLGNILRGQEGTTALAFAAGDVCALRLTALDHEGLINFKSVDNVFTGNNQFTQPIQGSITGNAATATTATTAGSATTAATATTVVDGAITEAKLAANAVTPGKIANSAVETAKIANEAVTTPKIANEAVTQAKLAAAVVERQVPVGTIITSAHRSPPPGYLRANGAELSRLDYADLFNALCEDQGECTISVSNPAIVTVNGNDLQINEPVRLQTTGTLPTGLAANTTYYVRSKPGVDTITLSATPGGTAIGTSGTQGGVHSMRAFPWGAGDGASTFNLPDLRGEFVRFADQGRGIDTGRVIGTEQGSQLGSHTHSISPALRFSVSGEGASGQHFSATSTATGFTNYALTAAGGTSNGSETRSRNVALEAYIKY